MNETDALSDIQLLQTGQIQLVGQVVVGSNVTLLVQVSHQEQSIQAIYKPNHGERPLWDFPRYSLSKREVAAFLVSSLLEWDLVPPTIYRQEGTPYGSGSLQLFVPHDPAINYFNLPLKPTETLQKISLFDYLINNADRKGGHVLLDSFQKLWLIDHGLCFSEEFKLRTVIWDFGGENIPAELMVDLQTFYHKLRSKAHPLMLKMKKFLTNAELQALKKRTLDIIYTPEFPKPEETRRSYPWPLV